MESGLIQNSQIYAKEQSIPTRYENKDSARLNSLFPGYKGSLVSGYASLNNPETYLQVTFDEILKVVSLEAQMRTSDASSTLYYFIMYGTNVAVVRPYTGTIINDNPGTSATVSKTVLQTHNLTYIIL